MMRINNELFRLIRVSKRLTQREFAKIIGISHGMVSHIETNLKPVSSRVSNKVINAFNLTDGQLEKYKELLKN